MCLKILHSYPTLTKYTNPSTSLRSNENWLRLNIMKKIHGIDITWQYFFLLFLLIDMCSDGMLIDQLIQCIKSLIKPNWTTLKSSEQNQWCSDTTGKSFNFLCLKLFTILPYLNKIYEPTNRSKIKPKLIAFKSYEKNPWYTSDQLTIIIVFTFFVNRLVLWWTAYRPIDSMH